MCIRVARSRYRMSLSTFPPFPATYKGNLYAYAKRNDKNGRHLLLTVCFYKRKKVEFCVCFDENVDYRTSVRLRSVFVKNLPILLDRWGLLAMLEAHGLRDCGKPCHAYLIYKFLIMQRLPSSKIYPLSVAVGGFSLCSKPMVCVITPTAITRF